jgi:hypothetical protein
MNDPRDEFGVEKHDSINEFAVAGEFGFLRVEGPLEVAKDGTVWGIIVENPCEDHATLLRNLEGDAAVLIVDGKSIGGGIITDVYDFENSDELHILVDQYAMGDIA